MRYDPIVRSSLILAIVIALDLAGGPAAFCDSCPPGESDTGMKAIEAFAKDKTKTPVGNSSPWVCVENDAQRLAKRVLAACATILDRDGDKSPCIDLVATAGVAKLGTHDIYAVVSAYPDDPLNHEGTWGRGTLFEMFRAMRDPRGLALIIERWRATIPRVEKLKKGAEGFTAWSGWRQLAASVIGDLGGADEVTFLDEQAKATVDVYVAQACRDAMAAIDKRLKAKAP